MISLMKTLHSLCILIHLPRLGGHLLILIGWPKAFKHGWAFKRAPRRMQLGPLLGLWY